MPLVPHVHGGWNDSPFDGNPEYFFSPDGDVKGPRYATNLGYAVQDRMFRDTGELFYSAFPGDPFYSDPYPSGALRGH